jgi:hypothetical protein
MAIVVFRHLSIFVLAAGLSAQYVDDRNLFEVLQDDLTTAMVHAHLTPERRKVLDRSMIALVKAAAKQRVHKPLDKAEIKQALKEIGLMEEANVFPAEDRKVLAEDRNVVELGVEGKVALDAPRRAPGTVY